MPTNNRTFYATHAVGLAPFASGTNYLAIQGLQSVGVSTKFNLEQIFQIGQLEIYQNLENIPDVEITLEKVLDGNPLIYHMGTRDASVGTLVGRSNQRAHCALSVYSDTSSLASGSPYYQCTMSGVYLSQIGYDIQVNGAAKETATFVGNNKVWATGAFTFQGMAAAHGVTSTSPAAPEGVNQRQHLVMASCNWPEAIPGINGSNKNVEVSGVYSASIQSVKVSANLGREQLLELGRRGPYFRYVNFPVEVSTTIEINGKVGDLVEATEAGVLGNGNNLAEDPIYIQMEEGLKLDLGSKNKLSNVQMSGGNAGNNGGNVTISYSFITYNDLTVTHPEDPTTPLAG